MSHKIVFDKFGGVTVDDQYKMNHYQTQQAIRDAGACQESTRHTNPDCDCLCCEIKRAYKKSRE